MNTELFDKAVQFATKAHSGQSRKKGNVPYLIHPLEVATIVATLTDDQEVIAASLLHDTVEDTSVTLDEIEKEFGKRVRNLVESETEDKKENMDKAKSWKIRKIESLEELKKAEDIGVKIIWLGDKISNMRSFYRLYCVKGNALWNSFNQKDPKEQKWYYESIRDACKEFNGTVTYGEYCHLVNKVFENVE